MKQIVDNSTTAFACWGIHVALTTLLAVVFAAYDGLQNTYPIVIAYMFLGWLIPFGFWHFFKNRLNQPLSLARSNVDTYAIPIILVALGTLLFLMSLFLPQSLINSIKINGQIVNKSDPRFTHEILTFRIIAGCMGLLFAGIGYSVFRFINKRK
jgi:hypothetical protein